jgi:hypothetical protein
VEPLLSFVQHKTFLLDQSGHWYFVLASLRFYIKHRLEYSRDMGLEFYDFSDFFKDNLGKILILAGLFLCLMGIFLMSTFYFILPSIALLPALSMSLGICFVACGFFLQVGLFAVKWRSLNGLGTMLLVISVVFFSLAISAIQIQLVTGFEVQGVPNRGGGISQFSMLFPISARPFMFLFTEGLQLGTAFLIVSLFLKFYCYFRT